MAELFRAQAEPEGDSDLRAQGTDYGLPVGCSKLSKNDPESGGFFVPTGDIRLSDRGTDGGHGPVEQIVAIGILEGFPWLEQHQHKELSRAFGPLSFQTESAEEQRLGQKTVRLIQGAVHRRTKCGLRKEELHGKNTHGRQNRCHPAEVPALCSNPLSARQLGPKEITKIASLSGKCRLK